jgi:hypothetical protein
LSSVKQSFDFGYTYDMVPAMYGTVLTATSNFLVAIRPVDRTLTGVNLLLQEDQCTSEDTVHGGGDVGGRADRSTNLPDLSGCVQSRDFFSFLCT